MSFLVAMHAESPAGLATVDEAKTAHAIVDVISRGVVLIAVEDRRVIGSIGGIRHENWWSTEGRMYIMWWYVRPDRRRGTGAGLGLYRKFKAASPFPIEWTVSLGGNDNDAIDKICDRLGLIKVGNAYTE